MGEMAFSIKQEFEIYEDFMCFPGCDKNLVDTEMMLGLLNQDGHTFTDDENEADIIVVNTCCFINDAKEEASTPSWRWRN